MFDSLGVEVDLPTRVTSREGYGSLLWKTPSLSTVVRILHNPAYAEVYVFGKMDYSGDRRSARTGKVLPHQIPMAQWPVKIDAHHAAYLSGEEYVKNNEQMRQNCMMAKRRAAWREKERPCCRA